MMKITRKLLPGVLVLPVLLGLAACDNPVEDDDQDHAVGLVVVDAQGTEVANYTVTGAAVGQIEVGLTGTSTFTVYALAEDEDLITIDGTELSLGIGDVASGWSVALAGTNQLVVGASEAGSTTVQVELLHDGHPDLAATFELVAQ